MRKRFLTALFVAFTANVFAERPSTDELAIRLSLRGTMATTTFNFQSQGAYQDGRAVTCGARVTLTWERHNGLWQIAREETVPLAPAIPPELAAASPSTAFCNP
jgi:ketosteroid isomerase-like protein